VTKAIFMMRTEGVGYLSKEDAMNLGVTGQTLRGSNCPIDLRTHDSYEVYDKLDWDVQVAKEGDCYARFQVRMGEMWQSCRIIRDAIKKMPKGPVRVKPPMRPKGEAFRRTEDSRGEALIYIVGNKNLQFHSHTITSLLNSGLNVLPVQNAIVAP